MDAADYARVVVLERDNQSLRESIRSLQHLLQVTDAGIGLKFHLLQAKERDNAQARARLQWLEVSVQQAAEEERRREAAGVFDRWTMLRYCAGLRLSGAAGCPPELAHLGGKSKAEAKGLEGAWEEASSVPATPSRESQRTPKGLKRGDTAPAPSPSEATPSTPNAGKSKGGRGRGEPSWRPKTPSGGDPTATVLTYEHAEPSPGSTGSKASPGRKQAPPELDFLADEEAGAQQQRQGATPCRGGPAAKTPSSTPSKRMAIVDPSSGKEIDITPNTEASRTKPTLISLEAISEGRPGAPPPHTMSPANLNGLASPPLNLPPVMPAAPLPMGLPPSAAPLSPYGLVSTPPPFLPGSGPPCPPPSHPAPAVLAGLEAQDHGAVQMARGHLAGGRKSPAGRPGDPSGYPPQPMMPPAAMAGQWDMASALAPPGPPLNSGTSGLLGFAGYGGFATAPGGLTSGAGVAGAAPAGKR